MNNTLYLVHIYAPYDSLYTYLQGMIRFWNKIKFSDFVNECIYLYMSSALSNKHDA